MFREIGEGGNVEEAIAYKQREAGAVGCRAWHVPADSGGFYATMMTRAGMSHVLSVKPLEFTRVQTPEVTRREN